ncbi:hypothetical protein [Azospirillum picis]|uniref:Transcriptional regulator n=1 Tax=Azospirillum picis TaxID=488438 RepID=A0ABU0MK60_9PROT|nr:hypothetical protein [Azospirillum picis]MBP2299877.1 hypothetical protein [Azospirillum picis]MDQ0533673.1 hypothetical protein [Azospirillum picis]
MAPVKPDPSFENATPVGRAAGGRLWFNSRTELAQARTLAGWITLMAEERELDDRQLAAVTGLDAEDVRAVRDGAVAMVPPRLLDSALRRLEGRNDEGQLQ